ncbi:MAG: DNA repair protein RecN, partial [Actinomycetota bacterium]
SKRAELIFDQARLEEAASRLEMIKNLKKKYGTTIEEVLEFGAKAKRELEHIEEGDAKIAELTGRRDELEAEAQKLAEALTSLRVKTSAALEKTVESELEGLSLKGCRFKTSFADTLDLTATGRDRAEFLISPNVGTGLKPLAKVASGGEVSRIMLALKIAFIKADPVPVLIFDEIDSGIGGEIAANVGQKLKRLADSHQVICITHLPQIASFGDAHLFVDKKIKGGVSVTTVKALDEAGRVEELSRMLTGGEATAETSRRHAKELLGAARKKGRDETK